jgi:hypothetical protein
MTEKMIARINEEIKNTLGYINSKFASALNEEQKANYVNTKNEKIKSMIEMLEIATGKQYTYDENGVQEYYPL